MSAGLLAMTVACGTQEVGPGAGVRPPVEGDVPPSALGVGESVEFSIHTHCGVESARINGRVWNAVDPLYSSPEKLGPPVGWGNPTQSGTLTLQAPDRAVFAALGQQVVLTPSVTGEPLRACD